MVNTCTYWDKLYVFVYIASYLFAGQCICDTNRSKAYNGQLEFVCMKRCFHATWLKVNADLQLTFVRVYVCTGEMIKI